MVFFGVISVPTGASVVRFYDAEMRRAGQGRLYLLSNGIVFEKKGAGTVFECSFENLASFEAVKKDRLLVVVRTPRGREKAEFKVSPAGQVEHDILQANQKYAALPPETKPERKPDDFDQDAFSESEARWFEQNWEKIMSFLKPERARYLTEFVKNVKIGSPDVNPYLLVTDYDNLTYKDFADLPGFLRWKYDGITENEIEMVIGVFRDFEEFSVSTMEMDLCMCKPLEHNFTKKGYTLYQFVAIVAREKCESVRMRESGQASQIS